MCYVVVTNYNTGWTGSYPFSNVMQARAYMKSESDKMLYQIMETFPGIMTKMEIGLNEVSLCSKNKEYRFSFKVVENC